MPETYALGGYGDMVADRVRTGAYAAAIARVVRPGDVVLDIGAGAGILSLLACRAGARRVYAVEPAEAIHTARAIARENGFGDRIELIQGVSTEIDLPERANVIVSDLRGALPLFQHHVPSIADARARLLAPGGTLIPRADVLFAAPVEAADVYGRLVGPWEEGDLGLRMTAARRQAVNTWAKARLGTEALLARPCAWDVLDYATRTDPDTRASLEWRVARDGTAHGLSLWFQAELAEGIGWSTGPGAPETIYGTPFVPFAEPVAVRAEDRIVVRLQGRLVGDDYVWVWETSIHRAAADSVHFRQSTTLAEPLSPAKLRRRAHDHRPVLGEEGRIDRMVLERMDGGATLEEIARALQAAFPARFARWEDALTRVGRLSEQYGA
ncbi:50S ribosomal protein L11 methyltransferase [Longimicrobium sp.]|uniref:50S ribosomal protein L11 methyltransferase n=1 Tax=Longimicrobium sp. TaxID=2029185 RepID=UPI002E36B724|nr:50S ribosomal protein L11 methyltransferase [Longimicrobium sp.]HEX6039026.1 50S ribosomal protein L11 methyltransferase [Longimicrobium sp.]